MPMFMPGIWPLWEERAGDFAAPAFSQAEKTRLPANANRIKVEAEGKRECALETLVPVG